MRQATRGLWRLLQRPERSQEPSISIGTLGPSTTDQWRSFQDAAARRIRVQSHYDLPLEVST